MPRDLFIETVTHRYAPKRSKWTIAGSILAHTALVGAVLVMPILSALDNYVVSAHKLIYTPPPVMMVKPVPPPPKVAQPATPANTKVAPLTPPINPVTTEVPSSPSSGPPPPPGWEIRIGKVGVPGVDDGTRNLTEYRPPEPKKPEPVRVGGEIKAPARSYYVEPKYPSVALAVKEEGTVTLEATIDEAGNVKDLKVIGSRPLLDQAAMEAVSKWRYTPTRLNGVAVPIILTVRVTFALR
jgi:protein TonB